LGRRELFSLEEFRKLRAFKFYAEKNKVFLLEDSEMIENLAEAYKNIPIKNILKEFLIF
jgi:hypothetical protein